MRTTSWKAQLVHNAVFLTWDLCPIALLNRLRLQCALKKLEVMEKKTLQLTPTIIRAHVPARS